MLAIGGAAAAVVAALLAASLVGGVMALPFIGDRGQAGQSGAPAVQFDEGLHFEEGAALSDRTDTPRLMVSAKWRQPSGTVCPQSGSAREQGGSDSEDAKFSADDQQLSFPATAGRTYDATVKAGGCGEPSKEVVSTASFTWTLHQETAATYSSGWDVGHCRCWSGKSILASTGAGQTATFKGMFTSFGLVAGHGKNRGTADIFLDGVKVRSFDGSAKVASGMQVSVAVRAAAGVTHTVLVKVTSGRVDIDAFVTSGGPAGPGIRPQPEGSAAP